MTSDYDQKTPERAQHSSPTRSFPNKRGEWTGEAILSFLQRRLAESRVCRGVLLIVLVLAVLAQIQAARTRPFSYDELLTVYVSSLRTPSAIWEALGDGVDGMPFTYHWLTGQISLLSLDPHISFRLLSIAGYLMGMIGVYAFVGKRFGPVWGLIAALLLALSPFEFCAHEARSYALLVGLLAVAAALWQRIEEGCWFTIAFAVCLGLAVASHHFAIVALGCFAAAELSTIFLYRGFRWRVWTSLIFSSIPSS